MAAENDGRHPQSESDVKLPEGAELNAGVTVWLLVAMCVVVAVVDPVVEKHGYFEIENVWAFYALFGFVSCLALVLFARLLGFVLTRPEDYYDDK